MDGCTMNKLKRLIGYVLFVPGICFYSFILGPLLIAVLLPGGLILLLLILGYKEGFLVLKREVFNTLRQKCS